jgi:hypothetical protein
MAKKQSGVAISGGSRQMPNLYGTIDPPRKVQPTGTIKVGTKVYKQQGTSAPAPLTASDGMPNLKYKPGVKKPVQTKKLRK